MPIPLIGAAIAGAARVGAGAVRAGVKAYRVYKAASSMGDDSQDAKFGVKFSLKKHGNFKGAIKGMVAIDSSQGRLYIGLPNRSHKQPGSKKAVPMLLVFRANEYGVPELNIPARPALGSAVARRQGTWLRSALSRMALAVRGRVQGANSMMRLGSKIVDDIERSYTAWTSPPNKPSTVKKKGFNDPLEETGVLARAWRAQWVQGKRTLTKAIAALRNLDRIG